MIVWSYSNIDIIQGVIGYGNATEGITDWRITNTSGGVFNILNSSSIITPSGGTSEIGEIPGTTDRYMIFTAGTSTITVPTGGINCDILIVGGGGGGGFDGSGGGGGGEVKYYTNNTTTFKTGNAYTLSEGIYTINVGTGGAAGVSVSSAGVNGTISEIKNNLGTTLLSAGGGGGGGSKLTNGVSGVGGGGGAGMGGSYTGGSSTGSGGIGGLSYSGSTGGGGGGGANVANKNGGNGQSTGGGAGGVGVDINITGISRGFGGGGGGGTWQPLTQVIGTQGGGNGGTERANPSIGISNTGGGGGGGGNATYTSGTSGVGSGGSGGSGIVIIRYSTTKISIIENGNVGIGITPVSNSSLLEIGGNINITGIYKKNNRNVISDTSNYVLSTSNLLVNRVIDEVRFGSNYTSRINAELLTKVSNTSNYVLSTNNLLANRASSQWTSVNAGIYYTKTIPTITSTPQPPIIISNDIGTIRCMVFTYTTETAGTGTGQTLYTINVPTNITCDVLIVGGGGGGDQINAGGGGGGAVLYATNITIPPNTYTIKVGKGGAQNVNGSSSEAFGSICLGGGSTSYVAWNTPNNGSAGGSGSGGSPGSWATTITGVGGGVGVSTKGSLLNSGTLYNGNIGGNGLPQVSGTGNVCGGGGGGASSVGLNSSQTQYSSRSSWFTAGKPSSGGDGIQNNITGTVYYWGAGGGGGGTSTHAGDGGLGGGGGGGITGSPAIAGLAGIGGINNGTNGNIGGTFMSNGGDGAPNSGSGGGGGGDGGNGGTGGSGIVIIRIILPAGNVGIGTTNPVSKLHVYDDTTNNTTLTIQNNYKEPVTIFPNTGYALTETIENNIYNRTLTFSYSPLKNYPIIPPIPSNPPNTTLLAWYKFNGDGLDYNTSATKYNLIANTGTPTYSSGITEDSFFQGQRYINTSTGSLKNTGLSLASRAFSIALWMRKKNSSIALFIAQSASIVANMSLHIGQRENNVYTIDYYGNGLNSASSYPEDINAWVHVVYVVLSNYNRRIYRNGVLIASDSNTTAFTGTGDLRIGALYSDNTNQNIDISDLRIYTTGLSATDIATLYNLIIFS
jgi:hypothetical protein